MSSASPPSAPSAYGDGKSTVIIGQGRRKVHTTFPNGNEMVEEFDAKTDDLIERRVRLKSTLGKTGSWEWEIGESVAPGAEFNASRDLIDLSSNNPVVVRLDRKGSLLWRVRNIPYPLSTYSVETDPAQDQVVIRTSNRKYFKRVSVPELARVRAAVKAAADAPGACLPSTTNATPGTALKISHGNNTLVIELPKPALLLAAEKTRLDEVKRLQPLAGPAGAGGAAAAAGAGGS